MDNVEDFAADAPPIRAQKVDGPDNIGAFEFLQSGGGHVQRIEAWETTSTSSGDFIATQVPHMYKHLASFGVEFFLAKRAPLTSDDLCICLRDGRHELWTVKDFPANQLVICPFSTEIKERYWTYNRSALCVTDPGCKPLVLDGRLWTKVACDGKIFSVFWLIGQTPEKKDSNLKLVHSKLDSK